MNNRLLATVLVALVLSLSASRQLHAQAPAGTAASPHVNAWGTISELVAVIHPTVSNTCSGTVRFTQLGDKVRVVADLTGLTANQQHAMHIHEFGDCTAPDGMSSGGHYNPEGHQHGLPTMAARHAGDLGNVRADGAGKAHYEITIENVTLVGMKNPIIGRAVIVHAKPDDGGQPVGNAGGRIGCGVIGIAKPAAK
jgi:Cu-Zn family superoxide dismutase